MPGAARVSSLIRDSIPTMARLGIISDTHGLLRPEALAALKGCEQIVHAGDIGDAAILSQLAAVAPVVAVRGNNDKGTWAAPLPHTAMFVFQQHWIYVIHDLAELDIDLTAAGVSVLITGHSHKPLIESRNGVHFVNPGSAGPRRFTLPISLAEVVVEHGVLTARILDLEAVK